MVKSKKMNKSTIAIIVLSLLLVVSLVLSATGAWFTDWQNGNKENDVTFGRVDINLAENAETDAMTFATDASSDLTRLIPGTTVNATAEISNNSTVDTYVYVKTEFFLEIGGHFYKVWQIEAASVDGKADGDTLAETDILKVANTNVPAFEVSDLVIAKHGATEDPDNRAKWAVQTLENTANQVNGAKLYEVTALTAPAVAEPIDVTFSAGLAEETINYVVLQEYTRGTDADSTVFTPSAAENAYTLKKLNGLVGSKLFGNISVRAIQADYFDTEVVGADAIYDYMELNSNFSIVAQQY